MAGSLLNRRRAATLRKVVAQVCPPEVVTAGLVDQVVGGFAAIVAAMSPVTRFLLAASLDAIGLQGLLLIGPNEARRSFRSVRDIVVVAYFDLQAVKDRLGYDPDSWTAVVAAGRAERWAGEIARHEEVLRTPLPRPPLEP